MRIVFVTQPRDAFQPRAGGSVALVSYQLATEVAALGHEVTIFAPRRRGQAEVENTDSGVIVRRVTTDWKPLQSALEIWSGMSMAEMPWMMGTSYYPRFLKSCLEAVAAQAPDAVVINTYPQYLPEFRRVLPQTVLAIHLHDELVAHLPQAWAEPKLAAADRIFCVREHIRGQLRQRFPALAKQLDLLPLAADPSRFSPPDDGRRRRDGPILFVGRLSPEKGLHVLATAFRSLHRKRPEVRLKLVGPPGMMPFAWVRAVSSDEATRSLWQYYGDGWNGRFQEEVWKRGQGYIDVVRSALGPACEATDLAGPVPYSRLPGLYREAAILVSPSVCVELPTPVYEAMGSGLPVILTYEAAEEGIIRDGETVVRVTRNDSEALAGAMHRLLTEPAEADRIGSAARKSFLDEGTWRVRAKRLICSLREASR